MYTCLCQKQQKLKNRYLPLYIIISYVYRIVKCELQQSMTLSINVNTVSFLRARFKLHDSSWRNKISGTIQYVE